MDYRGIGALIAAVALSGCITIEKHYDRDPGDEDAGDPRKHATGPMATDAGRYVPEDDPNDPLFGDAAVSPDADVPPPADASSADPPPPSDKDNGPVANRLCTGWYDEAALTLKITGAKDHVTLICTVGKGDLVNSEVYRLSTWNSHRMRCDVSGWVFATYDWYAYAVVPNSDNKQVELDCGPEPLN